MSENNGLSFQHQSLIQQGYQSYTPNELKQLEWGLRFTPAVCSLITLVGLVLQLPWVLLSVSVLGFLAFFFPAGHPMDLLYNNVIRHAFGAVALPPNPFQRRLACLAAAVMNIMAAVLFMLKLPTAALIVGGILLVLQAIVITTHFCTLSWMYEGLMRALGRWNVPIDMAQAKKLLAEGAELIDVRGPDEYARGHLPNARNIPLEQIKDHVAEFSGKKVLVYCYSGMRSHIAAEALHQAGLETAYNLGAMPQLEKTVFADGAVYANTATAN